jgi:hypothetical protein
MRDEAPAARMARELADGAAKLTKAAELLAKIKDEDVGVGATPT